MMRYVLCILALLLSCACVHVLAEEVPAADLSDQVPDTESDAEETLCDAATGGGGKSPCKGPAKSGVMQQKSGPDAGKENNISKDLQTHSMQPGRAGSSSTQVREDQVQDVDQKQRDGEESPQDRGIKEGKEQRDDNHVQEQTASPPQTVTRGTPQTPSDTDRVKSPEETQITHEENDKHGANDAQSSTSPPEAPVTEPSSSSSSENDGTQGGNSAETTPSNPANTNSAILNTPSNEESTTTTTTTTTLPPEPINNKKGDADSSSSISSSVWVRVPLLIVVTLACILVC
ncbi:uncharacterized protein TM35_000581170 [Trypanosoma theileri]|uniref:Mucin TcMUCII n=1 Tax=Trypanosoma theileri TaxID=67003 RepID=A0A1X0NG53_9TRYP|nr:uncharacterized protein TM35_000581170 [Trypanosoma theileri]ORC83754.1 hypothetical protein TM35_000581170 [Trypanosoma theileri]